MTVANSTFRGRPVLVALVVALSTITFAQKLPTATRVWSVGPIVKPEPAREIEFGRKGARLSDRSTDSQTGSIFAATRSVLFSGNRIIVGARTGPTIPQVYKLFSLDSKTGEVRDSREFSNFGVRAIFATNDDHFIVSGSTILRLTPDLKDDGRLDIDANPHRYVQVENASPDGSTLGNATSPGFELIDTHTLKATEITAEGAVDTSLNDSGFVTDNMHWIGDYPRDFGFVTYVDAKGKHLLYHGKCGGRPQFLTNNLILEPGCKQPLILDTVGNLARTLPMHGKFSFGGVSQNGSRFALQVASFDAQHSLKQERFVIYSIKTWEPIAEVSPDEPAEEQSWSAFSPDGSLFVVGSPLKLTLYRLP